MDDSALAAAMSAEHLVEPPVPLDAVLELARNGSVREALDGLNEALDLVRERVAPESWARVIARCRAHRLREFLHGDPFTFRCYSKPRGHCADATALDYVLRARPLRIPSTDPIAAVHDYTTHGHLAEGLVFRRDEVARLADTLAMRSGDPVRIFAAGCGHLRECDRMRSIETGRIGEIVAFDTNPRNLDVVASDYGRLPVAPKLGTLQQIVSGDHAYADFDVVCCGTWLDSLPQSAAAGIVQGLFRMVRRGGTLVISSFLSGVKEAGYADTYMDWRISCRSPAGIFSLVRSLTTDSVSGWTYGESPRSSVGIVCLQRR